MLCAFCWCKMFKIFNMDYKKRIKLKGLKMTWLALQCGVSIAALSNYINGKREMPISVKFKLNQLLK